MELKGYSLSFSRFLFKTPESREQRSSLAILPFPRFLSFPWLSSSLSALCSRPLQRGAYHHPALAVFHARQRFIAQSLIARESKHFFPSREQTCPAGLDRAERLSRPLTPSAGIARCGVRQTRGKASIRENEDSRLAVPSPVSSTSNSREVEKGYENTSTEGTRKGDDSLPESWTRHMCTSSRSITVADVAGDHGCTSVDIMQIRRGGGRGLEFDTFGLTSATDI